MKAVIITVGDEILIGQIVNTNAAWIGEKLTGIGVSVIRMVSVADDIEAIEAEARAALNSADIIIMTGGLGPTHDDITKEAVSGIFDAELFLDDFILEQVRKRFERRGLEMPISNRSQAMVPSGFEAIINSAGTAPALIRQRNDMMFVLLPGVPYEMKAFMESDILTRIEALEGGDEICQKTLLTAGIGESELQLLLEGLDSMLDGQRKLAYLPGLGGLRLRLTAHGQCGRKRLAELESFIRGRAGKWIYGEGQDTLESVVGGLLKERGLSIATAESCTGGYIAHKLTNIPGSSEYVFGGAISYSNESKTRLLGVNQKSIENFGAVSRQVACEMAEGVRTLHASSIGLSTSGIMGPGGGSADKPVGTLWIGIAMPGGTTAALVQLGKNRIRNKERAATAALNVLRTSLLKISVSGR